MVESVKPTLFAFALIIVTSSPIISSQQTELDLQFGSYYRTVRTSIANYYRNDEEKSVLLEYNKRLGKFQTQFPKTFRFLCDVNGPGRRSEQPPSSVHKLRPGDIDIIGALGDSLTSGSGVISRDVLGMFSENKGVIFSIGGDMTWREYLTLPNILKEFNSNLYGYSVDFSPSYNRNSRFNIAEPMAMSQDMKYQAELLYKRMKSDPNVNITEHWKVVTIFSGHNDICGNICQQNNYNEFLDDHKKNLLQALRFLRDKIPKLLVNYVPFANLNELFKFKGIPLLCNLIDRIECPCFFRSQINKGHHKLYKKIMLKWLEIELEVINRMEFHKKEDFTVILQPFSINAIFPTNEDGTTDLRYLASDCFHFSQRAHAKMANALWNNMFQQEGKKMDNWLPEFQHFECPTEKRPYIATRENTVF